MTTQYVGEAAYCHWIAVMQEGRLLALDTPEGLRRQAFGGDVIDVVTSKRMELGTVKEVQLLKPTKSVQRADETSLRIVVDEASTAIAAIGVCLPAEPDEHFYGLGQRFDHLLLTDRLIQNRTAEEADLHTTYAPTPFPLVEPGLWRIPGYDAHAIFDLRTEERGCFLVQVGAPELHLYFLAGPHPQTVIESHAQLVGLPPLPPE